MLILLDEKGLVPSLIQVARADGLVLHVPALGMSQGYPLHKLLHVAVLFWVQHQMKMVGHEAICQKAHVVLLYPLNQDGLKKPVIFFLEEYFQSGIRSVNDVIQTVTYIYARCAGHIFPMVPSLMVPDTISRDTISPFIQDGQLLLFVPRRGLEPPIPCGNYDLNVARLPISPPGQADVLYKK